MKLHIWFILSQKNLTSFKNSKESKFMGLIIQMQNYIEQGFFKALNNDLKKS